MVGGNHRVPWFSGVLGVGQSFSSMVFDGCLALYHRSSLYQHHPLVNGWINGVIKALHWLTFICMVTIIKKCHDLLIWMINWSRWSFHLWWLRVLKAVLFNRLRHFRPIFFFSRYLCVALQSNCIACTLIIWRSEYSKKCTGKPECEMTPICRNAL